MYRRHGGQARTPADANPAPNLGGRDRLGRLRVAISLKERHLAANPYVSLSYWDVQQKQVYADCKAQWEDSAEDKHRIWELYKSAPPPLGYDPGMIWEGGPEDPGFGLLKLTPWRIEVSSLDDMAAGKPPLVWRPGS